jgi:hypothetical protein
LFLGIFWTHAFTHRNVRNQKIMNNYVNLWRVENKFYSLADKYSYKDANGPIGVGPYTFVHYFGDLHSNYKPIAMLAGKLAYNEPRTRQFKNPGLHFNRTMPVFYSTTRPGPREDPEMREEFMRIYASSPKPPPIAFMFSTESQLKKWFDDVDEWNLLKRNHFITRKYRVPRREVIFGHNQCVWRLENYVIRGEEQQEFKFN